MASLSLSLLGPFQVTLDGEPVTRFGADTTRALLAYLAMHPGAAHRRDALAGLLWPEQPEAEALRNLRVALLLGFVVRYHSNDYISLFVPCFDIPLESGKSRLI